MSDLFYRTFEDYFRGSREFIAERLQVYLSFIEPLKTLYTVPTALDLGCGRGEWLELLRYHGFEAKGVDLDEGMLMACQELGLNVAQEDALNYIKNLSENSLDVISAFHVVEHISFESLRQLVAEAYRVLKPGGLLLLETPNPENLVVGTVNFYMDPTHQRPLPATLLNFLVEYVGFKKSKIVYLHESPFLSVEQQTVCNVLFGVSSDYAIVAQKNAEEQIISKFDLPFSYSYGVKLNVLAERYDELIKNKFEKLNHQLDEMNHKFQQLTECCERAGNNKCEGLSQKLNMMNYEVNEVSRQLEAVYNSNSWKIAAPLRKITSFFRYILSLFSK